MNESGRRSAEIAAELGIQRNRNPPKLIQFKRRNLPKPAYLDKVIRIAPAPFRQ